MPFPTSDQILLSSMSAQQLKFGFIQLLKADSQLANEPDIKKCDTQIPLLYEEFALPEHCSEQ